MALWCVTLRFEMKSGWGDFQGGDKASLTELLAAYRVPETVTFGSPEWDGALVNYSIESTSEFQAQQVSAGIYKELKQRVDDLQGLHFELEDYEVTPSEI